MSPREYNIILLLADGYAIPFNSRSHPIETTWHHKVPMTQSPFKFEPTVNGSVPTFLALPTIAPKPSSSPKILSRGFLNPGDALGEAGFIESSDTPNRAQYHVNSNWASLPAIDYVGFVGPSAKLQDVSEMLPFLRSMLQLSGQPQTNYFAAKESA